MTTEARRQYLTAIRQRYKESTKKEKAAILNEFCQVCGYDRKYAIRILGGRVEPRQRRSGPKATYDLAFVRHLKALWEGMERACSKKMVAAMPQWLPYYEDKTLTPAVKAKLLKVSPATIDRLLKPFKHAPQRGKSATTRSALLGAIPIELLHGEIDRPGFLEGDTVAHCGTSLNGVFANTLTVTDLACGWTENRATWNKTADAVVEALKDIEKSLPFLVLGFAGDNGSEFLNHEVSDHFKKRPVPVKFVRRRPYKKNDAAHVEQKNWTHVRQLFGYERLDDRAMVAIMNEIYRAYWNPLHNYFIPCMKLIKKERLGGRIKKTYDQPKTPCDRLLESNHVSEVVKRQLRLERQARNPFKLQAELQKRLRDFTKLVEIAVNRQRLDASMMKDGA